MLVAAAEILHRSPTVDRVKRRRTGAFAAGQMEVLQTALNVAQRKQDPIQSVLLERTTDIPENRVLTEAVVRAWTLVKESDRESLAAIYHKWMRRFSRSADIDLDVWQVERGFSEAKYGGARGYYQRALMLAMILLGSDGLGLSAGRVIAGDSVLLNTADVFERYLRNVISEKYSERGYVVTKGGNSIGSLYTDGTFRSSQT